MLDIPDELLTRILVRLVLHHSHSDREAQMK